MLIVPDASGDMHESPNEIDPKQFELAAKQLRRAQKVVVFTGAGISAESGIPTFRDAGGLWSTFPPEQFGHMGGLTQVAMSDPKRLVAFLLAVLEPIAIAQPNVGHRSIDRLEAFKSVAIITQNVDGLHQDAGSRTVHEVHGSLLEIVDRHGKHIRHLARDDLKALVAELQNVKERHFALPRALIALRKLVGVDLRGMHRPNIVLFGEALAEPAWSHSVEAASDCDVMLLVGTSGEVYPAAMLPDYAACSGAAVITVDPHPTLGDIRLASTATKILPRLVDAAISSE